MKNKLFRLVIICLFFIIPLLMATSCNNDDENINGFDEIITDQKLAVSDPQVKREVDFLYTTNSISKETYERWLTLPQGRLFTEYDKEENGKIIKVEYYSYSHGGTTDGSLIERKVIQKAMLDAENSSQTQNRMKRAEYMYDAGNGTKTIVCRIFTQSGGGRQKLADEWKQALVDAITAWNNLGLKVKFSYANASNTNIVGGYVNVFMTSLPDETHWVDASLPNSPGYFGELLRVNTSTSNRTPNQDARKRMIVHELGHIIGFYHTDDTPISGNPNPLDNIYNTVPTCNETLLSKSIMHSGQAWDEGFSSKGFSSCDKTNFKYYWGY